MDTNNRQPTTDQSAISSVEKTAIQVGANMIVGALKTADANKDNTVTATELAAVSDQLQNAVSYVAKVTGNTGNLNKELLQSDILKAAHATCNDEQGKATIASVLQVVNGYENALETPEAQKEMIDSFSVLKAAEDKSDITSNTFNRKVALDDEHRELSNKVKTEEARFERTKDKFPAPEGFEGKIEAILAVKENGSNEAYEQTKAFFVDSIADIGTKLQVEDTLDSWEHRGTQYFKAETALKEFSDAFPAKEAAIDTSHQSALVRNQQTNAHMAELGQAAIEALKTASARAFDGKGVLEVLDLGDATPDMVCEALPQVPVTEEHKAKQEEAATGKQ